MSILLNDQIQIRLKESPLNRRADLCQQGLISNVALEPGLCSPQQTSSPEKVRQTTHYLEFLGRLHRKIELVVAHPPPLAQELQVCFFAVPLKFISKTP